jgi:ankyrin repeat protein
LVEMKFPLNELKNNGISAVAIAAMKGDKEILSLLCEAGADVNLQSKKGLSPLAMAIHAQSMECIVYLIEKGAKIEVHDPAGNDKTPIFLSI